MKPDMKCPVCNQPMEYRGHISELQSIYDSHTEEVDYFACYNHDGGAVHLEVTWREYDKEEISGDEE